MYLRLIPLLVAVWSASAVAESGLAHAAGQRIGNMTAGAGDTVADHPPEWITIAPRSKKDCIAASGGILSSVYMRCRNGHQEHVRTPHSLALNR